MAKQRRVLTEDDRKFIRDNHYEMTPKAMATVVRRQIDTVYSYLRANKLSIHKEKKETVWYLKEKA